MRNIHADLSSRIAALDDFLRQHSDLHQNFGHIHQPGHGHHQPTDEGLQFRTIDGTGNNLSDPALNSTGTDFARVGPADFAVDPITGLPDAPILDGPNP